MREVPPAISYTSCPVTLAAICTDILRTDLALFSLQGDAKPKQAPASRRRRPQPPKAGAFEVRQNPPNTAFRRFYERGDLPVAVEAPWHEERDLLEGAQLLERDRR